MNNFEVGDEIEITSSSHETLNGRNTHIIRCAHPERGMFYLGTDADEDDLYISGAECHEHRTLWVISASHMRLVKKAIQNVNIRKLNSNNIIRL